MPLDNKVQLTALHHTMKNQTSVYSPPSPKSMWALGWLPGSSKPAFSLPTPSSGPCQPRSQVLRPPSTRSPSLLLSCLPLEFPCPTVIFIPRATYSMQLIEEVGYKRTTAASQVSSPERSNIINRSRKGESIICFWYLSYYLYAIDNTKHLLKIGTLALS